MNRFDDMYARQPHYFGTKASTILREHHDIIPEGGAALDIGVGQGRNALFLARRGVVVDGVDTSTVGIRATRELADAEGLKIALYKQDIMDFSRAAAQYDAVLALGIVPLLPRGDVDVLFDRIDHWTKPGGLVFVTAYLTRDKRYRESLEHWEETERNTFRRNGRIRTFLEPGEVLALLPGYETLHYREGLTPPHRHGHQPPERHYLACLLARKQKTRG